MVVYGIKNCDGEMRPEPGWDKSVPWTDLSGERAEHRAKRRNSQ